MGWLYDPGSWAARLVFTRGLALLYAVAFLVALTQFRGLIGTHGVTPAPWFLARVPFRRSPGVFHLYWSDRFFAGCCLAGLVVAVAGLTGLLDRAPLAVWMAAWTLEWALYLSIVGVGQVWYAFGWETLLCEVGFLAVFLGPSSVAPPMVVLVALRWVLFRLEFGAGLIKLRGDPCWRDLTCLRWHHETQPMPGPLSRWFHLLPGPLHRVEALANHVTQLVVVWGLFAPQPVAGVCALVVFVTQAYLVVSGNFAWLNALTLVLALSVLDGRWLHAVLRVDPPARQAEPLWFGVLTLVLAAALFALSWRPARNLVSRQQVMNSSFDPLRLVNTYGAFGSVTRVRHEVVLQVTSDPAPGPDSAWLDIEFRGKPGDVRRRPPQVAPYHLRLDWLMWFVAISPSYGRAWLTPLMDALLRGDSCVVRLVRRVPLPTGEATAIRAELYRYRFATRAEHRATGAVWVRSHVGGLGYATRYRELRASG